MHIFVTHMYTSCIIFRGRSGRSWCVYFTVLLSLAGTMNIQKILCVASFKTAILCVFCDSHVQAHSILHSRATSLPLWSSAWQSLMPNPEKARYVVLRVVFFLPCFEVRGILIVTQDARHKSNAHWDIKLHWCVYYVTV